VPHVNSRRDILVPSADPAQWRKVAAVVLTVGHLDATRQRMYLHICAHALLPGRWPPASSPDGTGASTDIIAQPCLCLPHLPWRHQIPQAVCFLSRFLGTALLYNFPAVCTYSQLSIWFKPVTDRAGFNPVNQQLDSPLMTCLFQVLKTPALDLGYKSFAIEQPC